MTMRHPLLLMSALSLVLFTAAAAVGQSTGPAPLKLVPESMRGADLFRLYCASCHGRDGGGHGPVAATMRIEPSDLTVLSIHSSGVFPRARVTSLITGEIAPAAHGSGDMPVWGPIFLGLDDSAARVKVRIANLVSYIESIQKK
jgi:mono/diheme cytochrome c family protein